MNLISILIICLGVAPIAYANPVGASCTITQPSQIANVVKTCTNIVVKGMNVPGRTTLHFQLKKGSTITFEGHTTFQHANWAGPLLYLDGENLNVRGVKGNLFDGQGAKYWDGKGSGGVQKPAFVYIRGSGHFDGLNLINCPKHCVAVLGSHITINNWNIDNTAGDAKGLACETDGFDVAGNNIQITNCVIKNQDDCIVVNRGWDCYFKNIHCSGSHGLSIGAGLSQVYEDNHVKNVTFEDCSIEKATEAIHVNSVNRAGKGLIEHITYNRITMKDITWNGISVNQDSDVDDKPIGHVPVRNLKISNVYGTLTERARPIRIVCVPGSCTDFTFTNINMTGKAKPCHLINAPKNIKC